MRTMNQRKIVGTVAQIGRQCAPELSRRDRTFRICEVKKSCFSDTRLADPHMTRLNVAILT